MKASDKAHDSKAKAAEKDESKTTRAVKADPAPVSLGNQFVTLLDQAERAIQSLNGAYATIDDAARFELGSERLHRVERLTALADRSRSGSDAIAAPANENVPVAPTSQPPVHRFVHGEPAATEVVQNAESEEAARISRGEAVPKK